MIIWVPGNRYDDNNNNVVHAYEILLPTLLRPTADFRPHRYETDFPREPSRARDRQCNESHYATHPIPPLRPARQPNALNCNCTPTVIKMYISGGLIGVLRATRSIGRRRPWGACHRLRRPSSVSFRFSPIIRYLNFSVRARTRTYSVHTYYYYNIIILH